MAGNLHQVNLDSKIGVEDVDRVLAVNTHLYHHQQRETVDVPYFLSPVQRRVLEKLYPAYFCIPSNPAHSAQHPVLNVSRLLDETFMQDYLAKKIRPAVIHEVGGNVSRTVIGVPLGGKYHCSNPVMDQADVVRRVSRPQQANRSSCYHRAEECSCVEADAYVSSHSLYYLTPAVVLTLVRRARMKVLIASFHSCFKAFGSLAGDGWYVNDGRRIKCYANNSSMVYDHPSLNWLWSGGAHIDGDTLCWTFLSHNSLSTVALFTYAPGSLPLTPMEEVPRVIDGDHADLTRVGLSWYARLAEDYIGVDALGQNVYLPGEAMARASSWVSGRPPTAEVYSQLIGEMRRYLREDMKLPPMLVANSVSCLAALAYVQRLARDIAAAQEVSNHHEQIEELKQLMTLPPPTPLIWRVYKPMVVISLALAAARWSRVAWMPTGPSRFLLGASMGLTALVVWPMIPYLRANVDWLRRVRAAVWAASMVPLERRTAAAFVEQYEREQVSPCETKLRLLDGIPRVRSFPPKLTAEQLEALPVDPAAVITVKQQIPEIRVARPIAAYGIINTMVCMPGTFDRSHETTMAMLKTRIALPRLTTQPTFDEVLVNAMWAYSRKHRPAMFGLSAVPITVAQWKDKYPAHQQAMISDAFQRQLFGDRSDMYDRGVFQKSELYMKIYDVGWSGTRPRAIQAGRTELHLKVVESVLGFQDHMKDFLHPNRNQPWCVPCGASPLEMGAFYDRAWEGEPKVAIEGDDRNCDIRQSRIPQRMAAETITEICPVEGTFDHLVGLGKMRGYTKSGYKIELNDYLLHSGDIWTYSMHCVTNVQRKTFMKALWLRRGQCLFCDAYCPTFYHRECGEAFTVWWRHKSGEEAEERKSVPSLGEVAAGAVDLNPRLMDPVSVMAALGAAAMYSGDDELEVLNEATCPDQEWLERVALALGYEYKVRIHRGPNAKFMASFCSGVFWPTSCGTMLGAKLGRWWVKQSWWLDPPGWTKAMFDKLLHGDARSRYPQCRFIPFLRVYWKRILDLVAHAPVLMRKDKRYDGWVGNDLHAEPTDETYLMCQVRYGIGRVEEMELEALLNRVTQLPVELNFAPMLKAIQLDAIDDETSHFY